MWNRLKTDEYEGMIAEKINITGYNNELFPAYFSRPLGKGPFPGLVVIHHMPGWDEIYREIARRFTQHGYSVVMPNLNYQYGNGTPEEMSAKARESGGVHDDIVVANCEASMKFLKALPTSNSKVGIIGGCSGGRHAYLTACRVKGFSAMVDLWGGGVVVGSKEELRPSTPIAPVDYTKDLACPMLGIFGNEDKNPTPERVNQLEEVLKKMGKDYEFHRYDGAPHGFWGYDRPAYRPEAAMDSWNKVLAFFAKNLS
jgi:carboxymethylenebutenolidase